MKQKFTFRKHFNIQRFSKPLLTLQEIVEERQALALEIESATEQRLAEIEARINELAELEKGLTDDNTQAEKRNRIAGMINGGLVQTRAMGSYTQAPAQPGTPEEVRESAEYRNAFLKNLQGKGLTDAEQRTLTTGAGATAAVPTQTLNMIIDKLRQVSVLFGRISVSNIPGNISFVVANAKNDAAWKVEGNDGTPADDTVTSVTLNGYELIKLVEISAAAKAMTIPAFEQYIVAEIGRKMAIAIENAILNGTGSGNNQPTGILPGIVWVNGTNAIQYMTLAYDNFVDALALLPTMYHTSSIFVMNRKTAFGGLRKIKDSNGMPLFTYNPQDSAVWTVLGYPVILDDYIADDVILLGDLSYYKFNFSSPVEITSDASVGFKSGKITYRGLAVADGKPALAEAFVKIYK